MPIDRNQHWTTWIKRLPIELRLTIYDFIDIETPVSGNSSVKII